MSKHKVFFTEEWGVLYAVCNKCNKTVKIELSIRKSFLDCNKPSYMKDVQLLMDRHCVPNAHAEKIVKEGYIGGSATPYIYELKTSDSQ